MKRILVAVDEDRQATHVIQAAGQLAKAMQATVVVCHVMPERVYRQIQEQQIQGAAPGDWFSNAFALDFYFKEQSNLAQALTARRFTYDQAERHARCLAQQAAEPRRVQVAGGPPGVLQQRTDLLERHRRAGEIAMRLPAYQHAQKLVVSRRQRGHSPASKWVR